MNPKDPVEEASYESFPASDPPAFGRPARNGDTIPPGQPVPKKATKATGGEEARARGPVSRAPAPSARAAELATGKRRHPARTGQNVSDASAEAERRADRQADRDAVHERDRSGS